MQAVALAVGVVGVECWCCKLSWRWWQWGGGGGDDVGGCTQGMDNDAREYEEAMGRLDGDFRSARGLSLEGRERGGGGSE